MRAPLAMSLIAVVIVSACGGAATPASPTPSASASGASVTYQGFKATPLTLEIAKGTTVTWTNKDNITHTITSGTNRTADGKFDSGDTAQNETFSFTFKDAGTFEYFCSKHTSMVGFQIVVR